VFGACNIALWPYAAALWVLSVLSFVRVLQGRATGRAVTALLAVYWAWFGIA